MSDEVFRKMLLDNIEEGRLRKLWADYIKDCDKPSTFEEVQKLGAEEQERERRLIEAETRYWNNANALRNALSRPPVPPP